MVKYPEEHGDKSSSNIQIENLAASLTVSISVFRPITISLILIWLAGFPEIVIVIVVSDPRYEYIRRVYES